MHDLTAYIIPLLANDMALFATPCVAAFAHTQSTNPVATPRYIVLHKTFGTFLVWRRRLALVQILVIQPPFASFRCRKNLLLRPHRMKLQNNYHDATLSEVRISGNELTLVADLYGHWNHGCEQRAWLMFHNVKNFTEICETLGLESAEGKHEYNDEIIGILKTDKTKYLVDLSKARELWIDCRGLSEV